MKRFNISQAIHDHVDFFITSELSFYAFQCPLKCQPKMNLLGSRSWHNVSVQLGLNRLDPRIDITMKGIKKCAVIKQFGRNFRDIWSCPNCLCLANPELNIRKWSKWKRWTTCLTVHWITRWMMRWVSGISTFCWRWRSDSSSSANFFFVIGIPGWKSIHSFLRTWRGNLTHFCIAVFACASGTNKCFEPWLNTTTHNCMQTLVWCFVPAEKIEKM